MARVLRYFCMIFSGFFPFSIPSYLWLISISITVFVVPILIPRLISHPFLTKYAHLPSVSGKGAFFGIGSAPTDKIVILLDQLNFQHAKSFYLYLNLNFHLK